MAKKQKEKYVNKFGVGLLLGAAAGYVVSYLTASKAGEELQDELSYKADKLKTTVENKVEDLKETFSEEEDTGTPDTSTKTVPTFIPVEELESDVLLAEANERNLDHTVEKGIPLP